MQVTIEQVENGFLVVHTTARFRKVFIVEKASDVVAFVKTIVDPSPVVVPDKNLVTQ